MGWRLGVDIAELTEDITFRRVARSRGTKRGDVYGLLKRGSWGLLRRGLPPMGNGVYLVSLTSQIRAQGGVLGEESFGSVYVCDTSKAG
jgi:hypothetical protein